MSHIKKIGETIDYEELLRSNEQYGTGGIRLLVDGLMDKYKWKYPSYVRRLMDACSSRIENLPNRSPLSYIYLDLLFKYRNIKRS